MYPLSMIRISKKWGFSFSEDQDKSEFENERLSKRL